MRASIAEWHCWDFNETFVPTTGGKGHHLVVYGTGILGWETEWDYRKTDSTRIFAYDTDCSNWALDKTCNPVLPGLSDISGQFLAFQSEIPGKNGTPGQFTVFKTELTVLNVDSEHTTDVE